MPSGIRRRFALRLIVSNRTECPWRYVAADRHMQKVRKAIPYTAPPARHRGRGGQPAAHAAAAGWLFARSGWPAAAGVGGRRRRQQRRRRRLASAVPMPARRPGCRGGRPADSVTPVTRHRLGRQRDPVTRQHRHVGDGAYGAAPTRPTSIAGTAHPPARARGGLLGAGWPGRWCVCAGAAVIGLVGAVARCW